jgi:aryl-alcohol dehydrogenase-like predicted oxidoreductase
LSHLSRIGLGTVQFGTDYGISNRDGRPSETEIAAILARAVEAGIGYLDTASSYGDAETLIGRHLPSGHPLRIVTKLPPIVEDSIEASHKNAMLDALAGSLDRLKAAQIYGLLVHQLRDLLKPGWQYLIESLQEARNRGWTARIGASIYDAGDLELIEERVTPDLVQLPFNALDRRLADSGWLSRLKASGIEVHARSLFLQGLLLMEPATLPAFFVPVRGALAGLHTRWTAKKLTPLAGCLHYVLRNAAIDAAIVGVNRLRELDEIVAALSELADDKGEFGPPVTIDPIYLDPRKWPSRSF